MSYSSSLTEAKLGFGGIGGMGITEDQLTAVGLLGLGLALGLGLFFLLVLVARHVWRWVAGASPRNARGQEMQSGQELRTDTIHLTMVTASDLFTIRSNLDAVSRQIEDLERKLRLGPNSRVSVGEPGRRQARL